MKEGFVGVFYIRVFDTSTRITKAFRKCDFLGIQSTAVELLISIQYNSNKKDLHGKDWVNAQISSETHT